MQFITALLSGLIFGIGLILSGMTDPKKVMGFLDFIGNWDPSLMFVMIGAISISFVGFQLTKNRTKSLLDAPLNLPKNSKITLPLMLGSALFGIGWGLSGLCPGPAIVSISTLEDAGNFIAAMLIGMLLFEIAQKLQSQ